MNVSTIGFEIGVERHVVRLEVGDRRWLVTDLLFYSDDHPSSEVEDHVNLGTEASAFAGLVDKKLDEVCLRGGRSACFAQSFDGRQMRQDRAQDRLTRDQQFPRGVFAHQRLRCADPGRLLGVQELVDAEDKDERGNSLCKHVSPVLERRRQERRGGVVGHRLFDFWRWRSTVTAEIEAFWRLLFQRSAQIRNALQLTVGEPQGRRIGCAFSTRHGKVNAIAAHAVGDFDVIITAKKRHKHRFCGH